MLLKDPWDRLIELGIASQKETPSVTELMLMMAKHGVLACRIDLEKVRQSTLEWVRDRVWVIYGIYCYFLVHLQITSVLFLSKAFSLGPWMRYIFLSSFRIVLNSFFVIEPFSDPIGPLHG